MAKCKKCMANILWEMNDNGKWIPLDMETTEMTNKETGEIEMRHISHFKTCAYANDFSSSNNRKANIISK